MHIIIYFLPSFSVKQKGRAPTGDKEEEDGVRGLEERTVGEEMRK